MRELIQKEIEGLKEKLNYIECILPEMEGSERRDAIFFAQVYRDTIEKLETR